MNIFEVVEIEILKLGSIKDKLQTIFVYFEITFRCLGFTLPSVPVLCVADPSKNLQYMLRKCVFQIHSVKIHGQKINFLLHLVVL